MSFISPLTTSDAPEQSKKILEAVAKKFGKIPNLVGALAHSPAGLRFYLGQIEALSGGSLTPQLREQIALTTAGINRCDYCASAHTLAGQGRGLAADELSENLVGRSLVPKTQAALTFAATIVRSQGLVSNESLQAAKAAGYNEEAIVEIIAHVAMNIFTNYFNHIAGTAIDFPLVTTTHRPASLQANEVAAPR